MNNLWASALANNKELSSGYRDNASGSKRSRDDNEQPENTENKPRVVWTKEMHQKFLEAVAQLGEDKAFPKKIVELMNVPGLTRANVASHLQKHRTCVKRAQEAFTGSSYDNYGFNTRQDTFQQAHWNRFQMGSRNTHFNYNDYNPRSSLMPQSLSLLKTIRLKPDFHNFSVYNDETRNVLLTSIDDRRGHPNPNTSFAGLRFTRDGTLVFGQNSHLPNMDNSRHSPPLQQSSSVSQGVRDESVNMSSQLSSLAALLAVDEPMTQLQPSSTFQAFDWDDQLKFTCEQQQLAVKPTPQSAGLQFTNGAEPLDLSPQQSSQGIGGESVSISSQLSSLLAADEPMPAAMTQLQPSAALLAFDWDEQLKFACEQQQQPDVMTAPQSANANSDVFSDFTRSLPPELCELGAVGDDDVIDTTGNLFYDDLLFENSDLNEMKEHVGGLRESCM